MRTGRDWSSLITDELKKADSGDVLVFVHGYNNDFDYAMGTAAQLWHFTGRRGVIVGYSWPAGKSGLIRGYTYDRESSEFTVRHLRETPPAGIQSQCPAVKHIRIVSHSRGTDVACNAVRELMFEARGSGGSLADTFKIDTLVLAAPDLDFDVFRQRFLFDLNFTSLRQLIIYGRACHPTTRP